jgi:hypothetical protein
MLDKLTICPFTGFPETPFIQWELGKNAWCMSVMTTVRGVEASSPPRVNAFQRPQAATRLGPLERKPPPLLLVRCNSLRCCLTVANLIGQHDIARKAQNLAQPPIRYEAIREGLVRVQNEAQWVRTSVHVPRINAGLAAGEWAVIEAMINEELVDQGLDVTVCDLAGAPFRITP